MIKGALFDIDDTLYSHKLKAVPKATLRMMDKLHEKGIVIGVCTSRVIVEIAGLPDELLKRIDCKILGTGATTVIEGQYIKSYTIDHDLVRKYIDYLEANQLSYRYTDLNGDLFYWGDLEPAQKGSILKHAKGNVKYKPYEDEEITNLFFFNATNEQFDYIDSLDPDLHISRWGNSGELVASLVDKSFGLLKFCQMYSLTTDEVVAAGDGVNDDLMLDMAGIGIAVKNAVETAKKAADHVCRRSIEDGGLYDAFVELGIIEDDEYDMKMFFFDNDSTLFDHKKGGISVKTIEALRKLKDKGYLLGMNTSRTKDEMYNVPKEVLDLMDVLVLVNGAYIEYKDHTDIRTIDQEAVQKIVDFFEQNDITYRYATRDGGGFINRKDPEHEKLFQVLYDMVPPIKAYEGEEVLEFLYYADDDKRQQLEQMTSELFHAPLPVGGEISPCGTGKGAGMLEAAEHLGVAKEKLCAFGDGYNDVDMLEKAALAFAVEGAQLECKKAADFVTEDISDEGISKALLRFGFIGE